MVAISRAPLGKLQAFAARMGWTFKWVSAADSDFNFNYQASFRPEDVAGGSAVHNYTRYDQTLTDKHGGRHLSYLFDLCARP